MSPLLRGRGLIARGRVERLDRIPRWRELPREEAPPWFTVVEARPYHRKELYPHRPCQAEQFTSTRILHMPSTEGQQGTAGLYIIQRARSLGLSIRRLAIITDIPRSRIDRYCRGGTLQGGDLPALCRALKCEPADLMPNLADMRTDSERRLSQQFPKLTPYEQGLVLDMIDALIKARMGT